jgi:hypothetical protein
MFTYERHNFNKTVTSKNPTITDLATFDNITELDKGQHPAFFEYADKGNFIMFIHEDTCHLHIEILDDSGQEFVIGFEFDNKEYEHWIEGYHDEDWQDSIDDAYILIGKQWGRDGNEWLEHSPDPSIWLVDQYISSADL